jgi:hypothetical protein
MFPLAAERRSLPEMGEPLSNSPHPLRGSANCLKNCFDEDGKVEFINIGKLNLVYHIILNMAYKNLLQFK